MFLASIATLATLLTLPFLIRQGMRIICLAQILLIGEELMSSIFFSDEDMGEGWEDDDDDDEEETWSDRLQKQVDTILLPFDHVMAPFYWWNTLFRLLVWARTYARTQGKGREEEKREKEGRKKR